MSGMGMNGANQTDNGHIEKMNAFLDRVTEEIVGLREKKMVREEMEDHIEDEAFELMDEGMNESAAYVEAVSRMGDANELAHELMLAHPYDSNNGFNKMLTVLWIGIFLIWLPDVNNMRPDAISWIGTYIMIFSLYRMRTISKSFRKAFYASYGLGLLMPITVLAQTQPYAILQTILRVGNMIASGIVLMMMANYLDAAVETELNKDDGSIAWVLKVYICAETLLILILNAIHGFPKESVNINVNGTWGFLIIIGVIALKICDILFIIKTWKIKRILQEESYAGIEPFSWKKIWGYLIPLVGMTLLPALVSIAISIWPVHGKYMMNLPEKEFSQLSNEEAKEQLLSILPEDEKTELESYDIFYFDRRGEGNWEISEGNPKMWLLRGKRVVPDIARGQQERVATFTVWENPKVGFKAASGFWIAGRYDMGDDIKKTCHQSFFAYEKDGMLYEFEPSRVWEMPRKTIAEYALNHGADRVYCYQALTVWRLADYNVQVGYEAAIQHSPLRILYDDFVVKEDIRNGGYAITEIVTLNNQMSLLDYGTVRTQSNSVWEKIGGIAHFVGEEGPERHSFYQYNSYGDWFEDLYQNGEWDTYDDDNWPDVSESSAQWQDYETGV
ncbi:MAG: permease prefix domain 1-containing protein [Lachnospiraceae bacterium]